MAKKTAYCALLTALAMILGYVEALIPFTFGLPGMKLGLANIVIVVALYMLAPYQVLIIQITRIVLVSFLFGNLSMLMYSLAGGIFSFFVMSILKRRKGYSITGISMAGGVSHNTGQILVAVLVVQNAKITVYLPVLLITGLITGGLIGLMAQKIKSVMDITGL